MKFFKNKTKNQQEVIEQPKIKTSEFTVDELRIVKLIKLELKNIDDTKKVVRNLKQGNAVLIEIESLSKVESTRAIAFILGGLYVLEGEYKKVASKTYLFVHDKEDLKQFRNITSFHDEIMR